MTQATPETPVLVNRADQFDAFISYSWANQDFVITLEAALKAKEKTVWLDRSGGLDPGDKIEDNVAKGIEQSHVFIFIHTCDSLISRVCNVEANYAMALHKKIIPIQIDSIIGTSQFEPELEKKWNARIGEKVSISDATELSKKMNDYFWLKFQDWDPTSTSDIDTAFTKLIAGLETDFEYKQQHTELLIRANDWDNTKRKDRSFLIGGAKLKVAEEWLAKYSNREPKDESEINPIQIEFILASRQWQTRLRNIQLSLLSIALVIISIAGIAALIQYLRADKAEKATFSQLQNLAVVNNMQNIALEEPPAKFMRTGTTLWVSHETNTIINRYSIDTGKPIGGDIEAEAKPSKLLSDDQYIWSLSSGGSLLTRITIADGTPFVIHDVPDNPQTMTVAGDWIWVQSEDGLARIRRATGEVDLTLDSDALEEQVPLEDRPELGSPVFNGQYLWIIDKQSQKLLRITNDSGAIKTVEGFVAGDDTSVRVINSAVWVTTKDKLWKIDPESLQILAQYGDVGTSLHFGAVNADSVWLITASGLVEFDIQTGQTIRKIDLTEKVRFIVLDGDILWAVTNASSVYRYNLALRQDIKQIAVPDTNTMTSDQVFLADQYLWLADGNRSVIYSILRTDGTLLPAIPGCQTPGTGLFDGIANVWFTCSGNKQLTRIPTSLSYFGVGSTGIQESQTVQSAKVEDDLLPRPPYFDGQNLWIILPNIGQLVVINADTNREVERLDFNTSLWPLTPDATGRYLWTAGTANGDVIRLDTQNPTDVLHVKVPASDITGLKIIEGNIWVSVPSLDDTTPTLFIISGADGKILKSRKIDQLTTQVTYDGQSVWVGSGNYGGDGRLYHLYATGQSIGENINEPTALSAPIWSPVFNNNTIWATSLLNSGLIFEFDQQGKLLKNFDTPQVGFPSTPIVASGKLWFTQSTEAPPIITRPFDPYHGVMSGVDLETQQQVFTDQPCQNLGQPIVDPQTQFIWVGCLGIGDGKGTILVIDSSTAKTIQRFEGLGRYAWPAVRIEDTMWVVFRDTSDRGNAAIFDAKTGQLITVFGLGQAPSQPVYDEKGHVWIANTGDGSIQQIDFKAFMNGLAKN